MNRSLVANSKQMCAVIGGFVGALFATVVCSFFPLGVESQENRFGKITCTGLEVVNEHGIPLVELGQHPNGGFIEVKKDSETPLESWEGGGVRISATHTGGYVTVYSESLLGIDLDGSKRQVAIFGEGISGGGQVLMQIDKYGGKVAVFGKGETGGQAELHVNGYGGRITAIGKGGKAGRADMGINIYGRGVFSALDMNGYLVK